MNDWRINVSRGEEEEGKEEGEDNEGGGVEEKKESWACCFCLLLGKIPLSSFRPRDHVLYSTPLPFFFFLYHWGLNLGPHTCEL